MMRTSQFYRLTGHAGLWLYDGPAVVVTDGDEFEHPDLVLAHQAADPANVVVVEPALLTEFAVADTAPMAVTA